MKKVKTFKSRIRGILVTEGKTLMEELRKATEEGIDVSGDVPLIYTQKADGVEPAYNIRTDRFEIARKAMEKAETSEKTARAEQKATQTNKVEATESEDLLSGEKE